MYPIKEDVRLPSEQFEWVQAKELESEERSLIFGPTDCKVIESCIAKLQNPSQESSTRLPDYAVMLFDEREHYKGRYEALFSGHFLNRNDRWAFYRVYEMEFPPYEVLRHLKGIIFPGSHHSVYHTHLPQIEPYKRFVRSVYYDHP